MRSRTVITAISVAGGALLSAGGAGAIQEVIHLQGVVDGFGGTGTNFSIGDPYEATITIDVFGDPVILEPLGFVPMTYSLTVGSYSASGHQDPPDDFQFLVVYEENPTFGDGVVISEEGGDFLDAPPLNVGGALLDPWIFDLYDSAHLEREVWLEPSLSEVLAELPSLPDPRFQLEWFIGKTVEGPITSVTVPEPSSRALAAAALSLTAGLAAVVRRRP